MSCGGGVFEGGEENSARSGWGPGDRTRVFGPSGQNPLCLGDRPGAQSKGLQIPTFTNGCDWGVPLPACGRETSKRQAKLHRH